MVSAEKRVVERAARAVGSVVLFDAQGTLFTQRASVAFGGGGLGPHQLP